MANPCCCCEVQTGVKALTIIMIVCCVLLLIPDGYGVSNGQELVKPTSVDGNPPPPFNWTWTMISLVMDLVILAVNIIVLMGAVQRNVCMLYVWYVMIPVSILHVAMQYQRMTLGVAVAGTIMAILVMGWLCWVVQALINQYKREGPGPRLQATPFQPVVQYGYPQPAGSGQQSPPPPYNPGQQGPPPQYTPGQQPSYTHGQQAYAPPNAV